MAIAVMLTLIATKVWSQTPAAQSDFQRSFTVSPGAKLVVENYKGAIHVTGTDGNQVVVDVHKKFEGSDADRKWWLENLKSGCKWPAGPRNGQSCLSVTELHVLLDNQQL